MPSDPTADIKELQPDVIVECHLEAKYYHYDLSDMVEMIDFSVSVETLIESDNIETDEHNAQ